MKKDNGDRNKVGMQGGKGKTGISEGRNVRKAVRERRHKSKGTKRRGVKDLVFLLSLSFWEFPLFLGVPSLFHFSWRVKISSDLLSLSFVV